MDKDDAFVIALNDLRRRVERLEAMAETVRPRLMLSEKKLADAGLQSKSEAVREAKQVLAASDNEMPSDRPHPETVFVEPEDYERDEMVLKATSRLGSRVDRQLSFALNKAVEAENENDAAGAEAWNGYVKGLRWVQSLIQRDG